MVLITLTVALAVCMGGGSATPTDANGDGDGRSVDGEIDTVIGGECINMESPSVQNPRNTSQEDHNLGQRPVGTDTIDGEAVYVYEIETGERIGTVTYYVDTESGYVRKMEFMETTFEYWDFGSVEPVESPC